MNIDENLKNYIENYVLPKYKNNDSGHDINHIRYVINRSFKFADTVKGINYNMVYVIAAYHDIGHFIDAKNHETISSLMLFQDDYLRDYFTEEEIKIMADAVSDHRASMEGEPRSIYGKIVSSADRNTLIDVVLKRTYAYRLLHKHTGNMEDVIEDSRKHVIDKFGLEGYAKEKMYFEDEDYKKFLEEITALANNREEFIRRYCEVNNISSINQSVNFTKKLIK